MLNTTQITNPACVTGTEQPTAAEKGLREHSIKGHRPKSKMHVDKSCHECMTPTRQALSCQKEGALEEPDIESVDEEEEDEEMGIHTMDKCTSCDRLTDTQCMNLLCEWCCESQDCECIAVPIPKPRSMIATRGTDTVSRPNYWSNYGFELCGARTKYGMACKNAKASCRHHRIYQPESELKNFMFIAVTLLQTVLSSIAITKHGLTNESNPFRLAVPDPTLNMPNYHIQVAEL